MTNHMFSLTPHNAKGEYILAAKHPSAQHPIEMHLNNKELQELAKLLYEHFYYIDEPPREALVWEDPELMASLRRGLEQAARGDVEDRGSFEQYADDEEDD